jgi:uncharacterized protein
MRIQSIDTLRGIAILGILFMNIYFHGSLMTGYGELTPKPFSDSVIEVVNGIFIDGRFRTLFCLLFGAGLAIQYQSCKRKSLSPKIFLTTRMKWLVVFGLLHGIFIFGGDILLLYSISALTILNYLNLSLKLLLKKAIVFLSIGAVLSVIMSLLLFFVMDDRPLMRDSQEYQELYKLWFNGYFSQILIQGGIAISIALFSPLFIYWQVAGLMMLGVFLYRVGFFRKGFNKSQLLIISLAAFVLTAVDITILLAFPLLTDEVSSMTASISAIFVALLYAHITIKLVKNESIIINIFSAPGKFAFSLYILQSITMAILLRFVIPELHLTAHRLDYVLIAVVFTLIQIALAHWYLRYFNQGPLEYIWRLAYQRSLHKNSF